MTAKLEHTLTLRIPGDLWLRLEQEIPRDKTKWIVDLIRERLDMEAGPEGKEKGAKQ